MTNTHSYSESNAIIVCNGEIGTTKDEFRDLVSDNPFIVCADGGANRLRRWKIRPHLIIGDMDSLIPLTKRVFSDVETIQIEDQGSTDLEKALDYVIARKYTRVTVLGATGNQIDHTLANISILVKYNAKIDLIYKDVLFDMLLITGAATVATVPGQRISLLPIGLCSGITTEGLLYPLTDESMAFGVREGVSNQATADSISVRVRDGNVLMMVKR